MLGIDIFDASILPAALVSVLAGLISSQSMHFADSATLLSLYEWNFIR